jgi:hypothetical protein
MSVVITLPRALLDKSSLALSIRFTDEALVSAVLACDDTHACVAAPTLDAAAAEPEFDLAAPACILADELDEAPESVEKQEKAKAQRKYKPKTCVHAEVQCAECKAAAKETRAQKKELKKTVAAAV